MNQDEQLIGSTIIFENMKEIALYCNDLKLAQIFEHIEQINTLEGWTNPYLNNYRQCLFNELRIKYADKMKELDIYVPENKLEFVDKLVSNEVAF